MSGDPIRRYPPAVVDEARRLVPAVDGWSTSDLDAWPVSNRRYELTDGALTYVEDRVTSPPSTRATASRTTGASSSTRSGSACTGSAPVASTASRASRRID